MKKTVQRVVGKKKQQGEAKSGALYAVAILAIAAVFGGVMTGGLVPGVKPLKNPPANPSLYTCCDTGDGDACKPILDKSIVYNGETYALLKSGIAPVEVNTNHLVPATPNQYAPDGRIFINNSNITADYTNDYEGCEHGKDLIGIKDPSDSNRPCFGLPDGMLIYVCRDTPEVCNNDVNDAGVPFDVYYRVSDGEVPEEIRSFCPKQKETLKETGQQIVNVKDPQGQDNLQLEYFLIDEEKEPFVWLGAWCKPAIYLYPEQKTQVNVQVKPQEAFTLTIPTYPQGGWTVTANPDGEIEYQNASYPYLYWESKIPDNLITEPKEGYVVTRSELAPLFAKILPELGLNGNETTAFSEYWTVALPESPYYFVGIVPQSQIDAWAPLTISPKPDSVGRVTLYFKTLAKKESLPEPHLKGFERKGFTVSEWGGLFKADKNHKDFTCIM